MSFWERNEDIRDRAREIATILINNGFSFLVRDLGLNRLFSLTSSIWSKSQGDKLNNRLTSEDFRQLAHKLPSLLEQLGPTFIKLGQFLSSRPDILPSYITDALCKLQENVTPVEFAKIEQLLDIYLPTHREAFAYINPNPLGTASIAQTHAAELTDGRKVVIKVRKPNVINLTELDLKILEKIVAFLADQPELSRVIDLKKIFSTFSHSLLKETNFSVEADNMCFFQGILEESGTARTPILEQALTNENILTMEYIDGLDIKAAAQLDSEKRRLLAHNLLDSFLRQVILYGVFHGDPHPGNIRLMPDGQVVYLDLGIIGSIDPHLIELLIEQLIALRNMDVQTMMDLALEMGQSVGKTNWQSFYEDMAELMFTAQQVSHGNMEISKILRGILQNSLRNGIRMPDRMILLGKAFSLAESNARKIDPTVSLLEVAQPIMRTFLIKRALPSMDGASLATEAIQWKKNFNIFFNEIPRYLSALTRGEKRFPLDISGLENAIENLARAVNCVVYGLIIASMLLSAAILLQSHVDASQIPIIHYVGYYLLILALSGTFYLYFKIFRKMKK